MVVTSFVGDVSGSWGKCQLQVHLQQKVRNPGKNRSNQISNSCNQKPSSLPGKRHPAVVSLCFGSLYLPNLDMLTGHKTNRLDHPKCSFLSWDDVELVEVSFAFGF